MAISDELRKLVDPNNECCCEHCLSNKCKEWATENKYTILTESMYPNGYFAYVLSNEQSIEQCGYLCEHKVIKDIPHNKTEPEAIFAACQWILDNKD